MNKELLEKYADLKNKIKELETELEPLSIEIIAMLDNHDLAEVEVEDVGLFLRGVRRTYSYPQEIETISNELKEKKKEAEAKGTASYVEKPFLIFRSSVK